MKYTSPAQKTVNPGIIYGVVSLGFAGQYARPCDVSRVLVVSDPGFIADSLTPEQCLTALNEANYGQAL